MNPEERKIRRSKRIAIAAALGALTVASFARADSLPMNMERAGASEPESGMTGSAPMNYGDHAMPGREEAPARSGSGRGMLRMGMSSSTDLLDPMSQEASGTAWLPASTPVYGIMRMRHGDMLMLHGDVHARYVNIGSRRGDRRFDAPNWFMGMYSHSLGPKAQLGVRAMASLDPLTEGGFGYPLLFQTGESWRHQPLHDRQHPHDLIDELSATYSRKIGPDRSAYLYLGYPGEPALGPPTYMHRLIAYDLADAPIGHHWQDATHITWGVATAGLNLKSRLKLEGSAFNGREPNENRYDFDPARFDSYSGRVSFNPSPDHSFQASYGSVHDPEGDGVNQHRLSASWVYNKPLDEDANFTSTLVWGRNIVSGEGTSDSFLVEADYQRGRDAVFGRIENIRKSGHELVLPEALHDRMFDLGAYTVGYVRDLKHGEGVDAGLGAAVSVGSKPSSLNAYYGSGAPVSFQVFLRLRPSRMKRGASSGEGMEGMRASSPPENADGYRVTATISPDPPKAGAKNRLMIRALDAGGRPVSGAKVRASVAMTSMDMGTAHPPFEETAKGVYEGDVVFSMAGPWRVSLSVAVPGSKSPAVRTLDFDVSE
jgi:hypothetical protein